MGNQNQKREGTKKKRKDKKKKHHAYALIVLILAAAIIILGTVLLFYIQEVEVSGNEYCDSHRKERNHRYICPYGIQHRRRS